MNCLKRLKSHKRVRRNIGFCSVRMPFDENMSIKLAKYINFIKASFLFYADLGCLIKKISGCKNNLEKVSTTKVRKHIP